MTVLAAAAPEPQGPASSGPRHRHGAGVWLAGGLVLSFLLLFFVLPVARVFITAFIDGDGSLTFGHFSAFFDQSLMREAFFNSLWIIFSIWRSGEH